MYFEPGTPKGCYMNGKGCPLTTPLGSYWHLLRYLASIHPAQPQVSYHAWRSWRIQPPRWGWEKLVSGGHQDEKEVSFGLLLFALLLDLRTLRYFDNCFFWFVG